MAGEIHRIAIADRLRYRRPKPYFRKEERPVSICRRRTAGGRRQADTGTKKPLCGRCTVPPIRRRSGHAHRTDADAGFLRVRSNSTGIAVRGSLPRTDAGSKPAESPMRRTDRERQETPCPLRLTASGRPLRTAQKKLPIAHDAPIIAIPPRKPYNENEVRREPTYRHGIPHRFRTGGIRRPDRSGIPYRNDFSGQGQRMTKTEVRIRPPGTKINHETGAKG